MNLNNLNLLKARFGNSRNFDDLIDTLAAINKPPLAIIQTQIPFVSSNGGAGVLSVPHALGSVPSTVFVGIQVLPGQSDLGWGAGTVIPIDQLWTPNNQGGPIAAIIVTAGGSLYAGATVSITDREGGSGATATATVIGGSVVYVTVTNGGSNYTEPVVTFHSGTGSGATATAVIGNNPVYAPAVAGYADAENVYISQSISPLDFLVFNNGSTPSLQSINTLKWAYYVYASLDYIVTQPGNPYITTQPANQFTSGGAASFSVIATGTPTLAYQWNVSTDGGGSWSAAAGGVYSGNTTSTLSISNSTGLNGYQYQCVVTNGIAQSVVSNVVTLNVT